MRSMFSYAALLAAVTMTGCCGTGNCPLSHGPFSGRAASEVAPIQHDTMQYETGGDCGCGCDGAVSDASWDGVGSGQDHGMVAYLCEGGDCGGRTAGLSGQACEACGDDAVVSVSAPFDCGSAGCGSTAPRSSACGSSSACGGSSACGNSSACGGATCSDAGCGCGQSGSAERSGAVRRILAARNSQRGIAVNFSDAGVSGVARDSNSCGSGDCGYGCAPGDSLVSVRPCDGGCGSAECESCGSDSCGPRGGATYDTASDGSCSGCDSCGGEVANSPAQKIRENKGLGLFLKSRGKMCGEGKACGWWLFGKRKPKKAATTVGDDKNCSDGKVCSDGCGCSGYDEGSYSKHESYGGGCDGGCDSCDVTAGDLDASGRRISNGIISDIKEMRPCLPGDQGLGSQRGLHGPGSGCGVGGCGTNGLCRGCALARGLPGASHPYGGATPHTRPQPGQSGMAPTQMYPYYTTRGPRDFLRDNPPSIGY